MLFLKMKCPFFLHLSLVDNISTSSQLKQWPIYPKILTKFRRKVGNHFSDKTSPWFPITTRRIKEAASSHTYHTFLQVSGAYTGGRGLWGKATHLEKWFLVDIFNSPLAMPKVKHPVEELVPTYAPVRFIIKHSSDVIFKRTKYSFDLNFGILADWKS